jgi:DNA-binding GntR family transcriptional regulator
MSASDLNELIAARIEIEGICLRRAIAVGGIGWESELVAAFHRLTKTPEKVSGEAADINNQWAEAHGTYHRALVSACDNSWFRSIREMLYSQTERYRSLGVPGHDVGRDLDSEHKGILDAVLARDPDLAVALLQKHLKETASHWGEQLEKQQSSHG